MVKLIGILWLISLGWAGPLSDQSLIDLMDAKSQMNPDMSIGETVSEMVELLNLLGMFYDGNDWGPTTYMMKRSPTLDFISDPTDDFIQNMLANINA